MKEVVVAVSAGLIIIINGIIGHYYPLSGILGTPIILGITSVIIVMGMGKKSRSILKSIFLIVFALFNDFLIRRYSGGIHDNESAGLITLYLFYGSIVSYLVLILGTFSSNDKVWKKATALVLFPLVMVLYMGLR
ncbi:MAG: hypothetical protein K0S23_1012 [Fluviicola sp.]|jgi:hypothetical protein|uniref:hypothetical protein n=1 Tax=Fluviicola sp. TaxID=1917219 RepID=UPI00262A029B|nr:hypothetical protein [Fluviicola sp.]MDF3026705.1 hypothetical protein [Fluviicola sp.]